jgi:hypothetical protein
MVTSCKSILEEILERPCPYGLDAHMAKTILAATSTNLLPAIGGNKP